MPAVLQSAPRRKIRWLHFGTGMIATVLVASSLLAFRHVPPAMDSSRAATAVPNSLTTLQRSVSLSIRDVIPSAVPASSALPTLTASSAPRVFFNGKPYRFVRTLTMRVTAYAPDTRCTWPFDGNTTASGLPVSTNGGKLVAADTSLIPFHDLVLVPGYANNKPVPVLDRGSAIKGNRLDILLPTFKKAQAWGVRTLDVNVYQPIP